MNKELNRCEANLIDIAEGVIVPHGRATVTIKNERGRVLDQEITDNFIGKTWKAWARACLRLPWMGFGYNIAFIGDYTTAGGAAVGSWPYGRASVPKLPITAFGCWNDTTAEDTTKGELYLPANATGMVAWASRWPFASPTGARGSVDTVNSLVDDDTVRFVFDWTSAQGNGTFQSVGWFDPGAPGIPNMFHGYTHRGRLTTAVITPSSHITGATLLYPGGGWYDSASGKWYFLIRRQATSGAMRIVSLPATNLFNSSLAGTLGVAPSVTGSALTNESDIDTPAGVFTSAHNRDALFGIDSAGRRIFGYLSSTGITWRWGTIPSTGASTTYAWPTASSSQLCGAVIGTALYAGNIGLDSSILNLNTATGATTATLTIDAMVTALCTLAGITTPRVQGIATDGTSLYVLYGQSTSGSGSWLLVRLNTSGVLQEIIGCVPHSRSTFSETTGAPFAGTWVYNASNWDYTSEYLLTTDGATVAATTEDLIVGATTASDSAATFIGDPTSVGAIYGQLAWNGSALYWVSAGVAPSGVTQLTLAVHRLGGNVGTRALLAAPKVKTVGQTMEITYDITLPGWS